MIDSNEVKQQLKNVEIVDFHLHTGDMTKMRNDIQALLTRIEIEPEYELQELYLKPHCLKEYLAGNGVTTAVVLGETGPGTNYSVTNDWVAEFCSYDDLFIPFGNINPNVHQDPAEEWERCQELGIVGFKFYPAEHNFDPYESGMLEVYHRCEKMEQPIMFHTGRSAQRDANLKYIRPNVFEDLFKRFPNLRVVLAHGGRPDWYEEAARLVLQHPNVYLDTALVPPVQLATWITSARSLSRRILFGSDWPACGSYSKLLEKFSNCGVANADLINVFRRNSVGLLSLAN